MDNVLCSLSEDEVSRIFQLIESLDRQPFDFLQFEVGDLKLALGKGDVPPLPVAEPQWPAAALPQPAAVLAAPAPAAPAKPPGRGTADTVTIAAALLGQFHAQPEPGAAPFVVVGSEIAEDMTVGLIKVLRTFNPVRAGVNGVITEICVQNAQLVEFGQVLFRVRPSQAA